MIKKCTWRPDTCKCVVEYEYDSDLSSDQITTDFHSIISRCSNHQNIIDDRELYYEVLAENHAKNYSISYVFDSIPEQHKIRKVKDIIQTKDENGIENIEYIYSDYELKNKIEWFYDENRKLNIDIKIDDINIKNQINATLLEKSSNKEAKAMYVNENDRVDHENKIAEKISEIVIL